MMLSKASYSAGTVLLTVFLWERHIFRRAPSASPCQSDWLPLMQKPVSVSSRRRSSVVQKWPRRVSSSSLRAVRRTLAAAEGLRVPMPLASLLRDRFLTLLAHGGDTLDWSAIGQLAAGDAGEVGNGVL